MDSKPEYSDTLEPLAPGRPGWAGAVLSILICTLAAAALFLGSAALRALIAHQRLGSAVYSHTWNALSAQRDLEQIRAYRAWLTALRLGHLFPSVNIPDLAVAKLKIAQDSASTGKEKAAVQTVAEALKEIELSPHSGDTMAKCPHLGEAFASLKPEVNKSMSAGDALSRAQRSYTLLLEENRRIKSRYTLLQQSLTAALGISVEKEEPVAYSFYSQGVLSGLPALQQVPDNILNFSELGSILSARHGTKVSDDLLLSIVNIRQQSEPLSAELNANETSLSNSKSEVEQAEKEMKSGYEDIILKSGDFLLRAIRIGFNC